MYLQEEFEISEGAFRHQVQEGAQSKFKGIYTYTSGDGEKQQEELASLLSEASMRESSLPSFEDTDMKKHATKSHLQEEQNEDLASSLSEAKEFEE